jgi:MATE family multidrug resistance protein
MLLNLVAYWAIGFPLAYGLGVAQGLGPTYVWVGLIAGLTASALLLGTRFHLISSRAVGAAGRAPLAAQAAE